MIKWNMYTEFLIIVRKRSALQASLRFDYSRMAYGMLAWFMNERPGEELTKRIDHLWT